MFNRERSRSVMHNPQSRPNRRKKSKDPVGNRSTILSSAMAEFAARGLHGARIESIAKTCDCDKQLIYYYFKSKEDLYIASIEESYRQIRHHQLNWQIDDSDPLRSLIDIVLASYDFVIDNTDLIRLISNENLEKAEYIKKSSIIRGINIPIIVKIEHILEAGASRGIFRSGLNAVELHRLTSALINHNVNNSYTFGYIFDVDLLSKNSIEAFRHVIADVITRYVTPAG